ncbi:hypothetical protein [Helicobacter suis]|uniref:hypothetical protein n=1 Tax=Helicobacter suis TaxID=104628 RepID=UPI0013D5314A|nr:hypothetical protein [Helicobacter suis]
MGQKDNLYFGGGSLFIYPLNGKSESIDIGCLELSLSRDSQKTTAWTRANGAKQKLAEVVTEESYSLKIKGNNFAPEALSLVLDSEVQNRTYKKGDLLPYGGYAQWDTKIQVLSASSRSESLPCKLEFVGKPIMGKQIRAVFYEVNLSLDGELNLLSDEFANIALTGVCASTAKGVFDYYYVDLNKPLTQAPADSSNSRQIYTAAGNVAPDSPTTAAQTPVTPAPQQAPQTPAPQTPQTSAIPADDNDLERMVEELENQAIKEGKISAEEVNAAREATRAANPDIKITHA